MSEFDWTAIPGSLLEAGFSVCYTRVSYDPERPLWCAKASRGGREWSSMAESLCAAFLKLEGQTLEAAGDWRKLIALEVLEANRATRTA